MLLELGIGFTDLCKTGAGMDHQALVSPIDLPAFREKIRRYRPGNVAFTSKKAASLFYKPADEIADAGPAAAAGRLPNDLHPAFASGAASGSWLLQPWQELGGFDPAIARTGDA